jgi:hypothetical protein
VDIRAHYVVVDRFFADARALRSAYVARFGERVPPFDRSRFAWEYWHVPGQFAQHRAPARDVFPPALLDRFEARLLAWSGRALGLGALGSPPWVSFVLHGDYQGIHRDSPNGVFAFTFGLSRPGRPRFAGGETLLARPELLDYWRRGGAREDAADQPLFEVVPAAFNRLVAFDSRIPHAVRTVEGPRDPRDGRVAIQGWLRADGCTAQGALAKEEATAGVGAALRRVPKSALKDVAGLLSVRFEVAASGRVKRATAVVDTLVATGRDPETAARAGQVLLASAVRMRFAERRAPSVVVAPVCVGGGTVKLSSQEGA